MQLFKLIILIVTLLLGCDKYDTHHSSHTDPELANIDFDKYVKSSKYADFNLFQFAGVKKLVSNTKKPYIQIAKGDTIVSLLIHTKDEQFLEKTYEINDDYYFERETQTEKGDTTVFYRYFTQESFLEYTVIQHKPDGSPIGVHITYEKYTKNKSHFISLYGDESLLNLKLSPETSVRDIPKKYILYEVKRDFYFDDAYYIEMPKTISHKSVNESTATSTYKTKYLYSEFPYNNEYSLFWNEYLDYKGEGVDYSN